MKLSLHQSTSQQRSTGVRRIILNNILRFGYILNVVIVVIILT